MEKIENHTRRESHIDRMQDRFNKIRSELLILLDISQDTYNEIMFNSAYEYLDKSTLFDAWAKQKLTTNPKFWSWWKNEFYIQDELTINIIKSSPDYKDITVERLRDYYYSRHVNAEVFIEKSLHNYLYQERLKEEKKQSGKQKTSQR